ncbi:unnamed protein product [Microthlaspi erraticum]|uniref:Uncharacterized protein n=1 Tax=Microthlaspi erraticum TaxID=1685480 RepID=A0A6D2HDQ9_9BRAS|nr:unnamed protein product [Microthlaspi erraticum]
MVHRYPFSQLPSSVNFDDLLLETITARLLRLWGHGNSTETGIVTLLLDQKDSIVEAYLPRTIASDLAPKGGSFDVVDQSIPFKVAKNGGGVFCMKYADNSIFHVSRWSSKVLRSHRYKKESEFCEMWTSAAVFILFYNAITLQQTGIFKNTTM